MLRYQFEFAIGLTPTSQYLHIILWWVRLHCERFPTRVSASWKGFLFATSSLSAHFVAQQWRAKCEGTLNNYCAIRIDELAGTMHCWNMRKPGLPRPPVMIRQDPGSTPGLPSTEYSPFSKNFTIHRGTVDVPASPSSASSNAMKVAGMPMFLQLLGKCIPSGISPHDNGNFTTQVGNCRLTRSHKMRSWARGVGHMSTHFFSQANTLSIRVLCSSHSSYLLYPLCWRCYKGTSHHSIWPKKQVSTKQKHNRTCFTLSQNE